VALHRAFSPLAAASIAVALAFATPSLLIGYTTIGGSLPIGTTGNGYQRDVRVYNNFPDASANTNTIADANFPGALGAPLAIWKAAAAWDSSTPTTARNFDYDWQGETQGIGTVNDNVVSSLTNQCGGGVLAYTETPDPINNGWRIRYCEEWVWSDGPGSPTGSQIDMQGVATHELGHALGLGHAQSGPCSVACNAIPVMCPVICSNGTTQRFPRTDDVAGLTSIYGVIPANKPAITSVTGAFLPGATLTINGTNFAPNVVVKFTAGTSLDVGAIPGVVTGLVSTAGGTQIAVTVPANARPGNVLVWEPARNLLSNPFPVAPPTPTLMAVTPSSGRLRGGEPVTIDGTNFASNASVLFDGVAATVTTRNGTTQLIVQSPPGTAEGQAATVSVVQAGSTVSLAAAFTYTPNAPELVITGTPVVGSPVLVTVYGPANRRAALGIGMVGTTTRRGVEACLTRPTELVRTPDSFRLDAMGQVTVTWIPEGLPGDVRHAQAAVIQPDRTIVLTNCIELTEQ
jgi:IPT/TIG domain-containing protein/matrixin